jgi:hypothetical protein
MILDGLHQLMLYIEFQKEQAEKEELQNLLSTTITNLLTLL